MRQSHVHCMRIVHTVKFRQPGAVSLRTRGHNLELPTIKYEINKRKFIVCSLLNYAWFCPCANLIV